MRRLVSPPGASYLDKVAWIRDPNEPPGIAAPGYLNCPCGAKPWCAMDDDEVRCECGTVYTGRGFVISRP